MKPLNILSLFDWMSCGMIALERVWIPVNKYYASEIDKYSILISKKNYPDIIHLWDVNNWRDWDLSDIDLIIWGSPCQWFSFAGKQLAFDDPRSKLFFTMVDIINHFKPKYFLLENVRMKKEYQDVITKYMGVEPININSKLVSAQLRNRFYRTNIPWVTIPEDKWIELSSIIEKWWTDRKKSRAILESESIPLVSKENMVHRYFNTWFTTVIFKNNELSEYAKSRVKERLNGKKWVVYNWFNDTVRDNKSSTLLAWSTWRSWKWTNLVISDDDIRYFTQTELERLQTLPEWYTSCLSRNKAAWVIWNWRTVDVIAHIFSYLNTTYA